MKKLLTTSGLLIGIGLLLAVNIISNTVFTSTRVDMTANKLFTLSEGTHNILQSLQEPITLRLYLSEKLVTQLPGINSYANRVKEILHEYQRIAGDKLTVKIIDPEPFSEAEDRAVGFGLQGVATDNSNTNTFYFGLAGTNSVDDEQVIKFFQPNRESFLEYDLTKLVYQLANPKKTVLGIMSNAMQLPVFGTAGNQLMQQLGNMKKPWMIVQQLQQLFDVKQLQADIDVVPEDVDLLMVIHPKALEDKTLYAIDQFVLNGGNAIVFVDPHAEAEQQLGKQQFGAAKNSSLDKLFEQWGVELVADKIVGDITAAQRVQINQRGRAKVVEYPVWMDLGEDNYATDDIITGQLDNINLASAGALKHKDGATSTFQPLIQTSDQGALIDASTLRFMPDPERILKDYKPEGKFTIAARVSGKFKTAFPDGKPPEEKEDDKDGAAAEKEPKADKPHIAESKSESNLIIFADTDMLQDRFWVSVQNFLGQSIGIPHAANATLITNAVDNLSGSSDLISVRNRGTSARPFTRVEALQKQAEQQFREEEQKLRARLEETDKKINELQSKKEGKNVLVLSEEQQREIEQFLQEKVVLRKALRNVQHDLRKNIESLENAVQFANIGLMPLLVGIGGLGVGYYRSRRRRTRK